MADFSLTLRCGLAIGLLALSATGCASWRDIQKAVRRNQADDVGPEREKRKAELAKSFDRKRDEAQFDAAAAAWERGDVQNCQMSLTQLLERNPAHSRARMLLADLYLFHGKTEESLAELRKVVAAEPKNAAAQHALAQGLDAAGHGQEAKQHYELATQIEPTNELFAMSYKTALGVKPRPRSNQLLAAKTNRQPATDQSQPAEKPTATSPAPTIESPPATRIANDAAKTNPSKPGHFKDIVKQPAAPTDHSASLSLVQTIEKPLVPFTPPSTAMQTAIQTTGLRPKPDKVAWRLNDDMRDRNRGRLFAPPTDVNDWVRPVDFAAADDESDDSTPVSSSAPVIEPPPAARLAKVDAPPVLQAVPTGHPIAGHHSHAETAIPPAITSRVRVPVVTAAQASNGPSAHDLSVQPASLETASANPQNSQNPLQLAAAALAAGNTEAAINVASRGLAQTPDQAAPLYRILGAAHYRRREYEAAQAALAQALSLDKADALAYFLMGSTLSKLNEPEAAARYLAEAARLDTRFAD